MTRTCSVCSRTRRSSVTGKRSWPPSATLGPPWPCARKGSRWPAWSGNMSRPRAVTRPVALGDLPSSTPESVALSAQLRKHGFRFVGPTTVYAAMQSLGVVNDHLHDCHFRAVCESARAGFNPPGVRLKGPGAQ